jgi:hypothetical protein
MMDDAINCADQSKSSTVISDATRIYGSENVILICFSFPSFFREYYFASAAWVSTTEVSVVWMNRPQNLSVVTLCKSPMWYCQEVRRKI